jgi:thymidylate kinase
MIIEVIGPAGSGKTTLVRNIYKANKNFDNGEMAAFRGLLNCPFVEIRFAKLLRLIPLRLAYILRLTRMTHIYRDQILRGADTQKLEPYLSHILQAITKMKASEIEKLWLLDKCKDVVTDYILFNLPVNKDRIIFIDEFLVQKILSIYYIYTPSTTIDSEEKEYLRLVPKPEAIVFLNTDLDIAARRVTARSKGRPHVLKNLTANEFIETNQRFKLVEKNVCDYVAKEFNVKIIETSNNSNLKETFEFIVKQV